MRNNSDGFTFNPNSPYAQYADVITLNTYNQIVMGQVKPSSAKKAVYYKTGHGDH